MNHKAPFRELHEIKIKCVLQNVWLHLSVSNCRFSVTKTILVRHRCIKQLKNLNDESLQADATLHFFACRFLMHFSVQELICWLHSLFFSPLHQHLVTSCLSALLRSLRGRLSLLFLVSLLPSLSHASIRVFSCDQPQQSVCIIFLDRLLSLLCIFFIVFAQEIFFCQQVTSGRREEARCESDENNWCNLSG